MKKKKNAVIADTSAFERNEMLANWFSAKALLVVISALAVMWLLNMLNVFNTDKRTINVAFFTLLPILLSPYILLKFFHIKAKWLKHLIMACTVIMTCYLKALLTYNVAPIIVVPVLLSCHYFSREFTIRTSAITAVGCAAATAVGSYFGSLDANNVCMIEGTQLTVVRSVLTAIRESGAIDYEQTLIENMIFVYIPELCILIGLTPICAIISKRTMTLLQNQIEATAENERIGAELDIATNIQDSMLPKILPTFPGRDEFDLFASMHPAKEVGGDFYDSFFVDSDHFVFVMADVSGKGVPAALFMVIAKTLIKNHLQAGLSPEAAFTETNNQLCEGNDENMFVTAWAGLYEISTGMLTYVNAGHNPPLLRRADGEFEYIHDKPELILAIADGVKFHQKQLRLQVGDRLYLYTDGVTEATNAQNKLYGEERLKSILDENSARDVKTLCENVKADVDKFVGEAPQFDDITMLSVLIKQCPGAAEKKADEGEAE